ncbi:hypothetical protein VPMG_00040 [Vibrio phage VBP32]|uniref:Uncharacterized protein n=2 Tax=Stoningtonvirus VBP47 TaxID=2846606 RepID=M4SL90_9CAUD|nr:hypothetical protein VPNG_00088 [Vibrio phage VBP47]YP_007676530.1 hypothetical protein VPMG_00040 [Vibrio phage VBP32]AGH57112.1 hypothetical protein VPNG_00088 [Vibrio phage VBP47]AGH57179.1 hypothetical protein VPMG_00040 [Vibrio phage VBP32]
MFRRSIASKNQVEYWMIELRAATLTGMAVNFPRDMHRMSAVYRGALGFINILKYLQKETSKPEGK